MVTRTVIVEGHPLTVELGAEESASHDATHQQHNRDWLNAAHKPDEHPLDWQPRLDLGCVLFLGAVCLLLGFILRDWTEDFH